jgi:hypothetical protein
VIELKKALDRKLYPKNHEMVIRLNYMKKLINKARGVKTIKLLPPKKSVTVTNS